MGHLQKVQNLYFIQYVSWNGNSTLSEDRFTRIKYGMLYVKSKVRLSRVMDNDYSLNLNVIMGYHLSLKQ